MKRIASGRFLSLTSLIMAGLIFCGCTQGQVSPSDSAEQTPSEPGISGAAQETEFGPEDGPLFLGTAPLSHYRIIYPSGSLNALCAANTLAKAISRYTGVYPEIYDDTSDTSRYEILIGKTNRAESPDYAQRNGKDGYAWYAENGKLVITASNSFLLRLTAERLADKICVQKESFLSAGSDFSEDISSSVLYITSPTSKAAKASEDALRIMSYNILSEDYNDKLPISGRDSKVAKTVYTYKPDVIGFEEVTEAWHTALAGVLEGSYAFIPDYMTDGGGSSMSTLMYNTETVEYLECGTTAYSASSNKLLRNLTWAVFRRISDGERFIVTCTHWDINSNAEYRKVQVKENITRLNALIAEYKLPVFCCGDYNRNSATEEYKSFLSGTGLLDSKLVAISKNVSNDASDTIDHVALSKEAEVLYYAKVTDTSTVDASDHKAVFTDVRISGHADKTPSAKAPADYSSALSASSGPAVPYTGSGTKTDPCLISSEGNLRYLAGEVLAGNTMAGKYFSQTCDIALSGEWMPIGTSGFPFSGSYDGNGHSVTGLCITGGSGCRGLFGCVASVNGTATSVSSLSISGKIEITNTDNLQFLGGAVGTLGIYNTKTVRRPVLSGIKSDIDITVTGTEGEPRIGGIAGRALMGEITGCTYSGSIVWNAKKPLRAGGISGQSMGTEFRYCTFSGSLELKTSSGTLYSGGISALNSRTDFGNSLFEFCQSTGSISSESASGAAYAAGICGCIYSSDAAAGASAVSCLNTGKLKAVVKSGTSLAYAGGIIGYCNKTGFTVKACVNTQKSVNGTAPGGTRSGGIFSVFNCKSDTASVICEDCFTVGVLYGYNANTVKNCTSNMSEAEATEKANAITDAIKNYGNANG